MFVTEIYYLWVAVPSLFIQFLMNSCSCYFYCSNNNNAIHIKHIFLTYILYPNNKNNDINGDRLIFTPSND